MGSCLSLRYSLTWSALHQEAAYTSALPFSPAGHPAFGGSLRKTWHEHAANGRDQEKEYIPPAAPSSAGCLGAAFRKP